MDYCIQTVNNIGTESLKPDEPEPKRGYDESMAKAIGGHYVGERPGGTVRGQPAWGVASATQPSLPPPL
jgi:hypothetical protein